MSRRLIHGILGLPNSPKFLKLYQFHFQFFPLYSTKTISNKVTISLAIFKFNGKWYAITSSFTAGTILWEIEDPTSTVFTYVKTIFEKGRENPCIYPVTTSNGEIRFMMSLATDTEFGSRHKIYVFDTHFNLLEEYDIITIEFGQQDTHFT
ncbi:MAG: hypothetical protein QXK54_03615 [Ignisphaera sp.]